MFDGRPTEAKVRFEGNTMLVANPQYGEDTWELVQPWTPASLDEFIGEYVSDDAETTLRVELKDGKLELHRRPNKTFVLKPTYSDAFSSSMGNVHFVRGPQGKPVAFDLGSARVWSLRFTRKEPAAADKAN